jgi:hypothetical protein
VTTLGRSLFIFTAYAPLWLLIGVRFFAVDPAKSDHQMFTTFGWVFIIVFLMAGLIFLPLVRLLKRANLSRVFIKSVSRRDDHILSYAVTYFPPLFSINLGNYVDIVSLIIIYVTVFIVYIRLDAIYVNPLFAIIGYRIYEITSDMDITYTVLAKDRVPIRVGSVVRGSYRDGILLIDGSDNDGYGSGRQRS